MFTFAIAKNIGVFDVYGLMHAIVQHDVIRLLLVRFCAKRFANALFSHFFSVVRKQKMSG
jgi:hypothetical protein